jgi:hypothetical protein
MLGGLNSSCCCSVVFGLLGVPCLGHIAHVFDDQLGIRKLYSAGAGWDLGLGIGSV